MTFEIKDREFTPNFVSLDLFFTTLFDKTYVTINHDQSIKDDISSDTSNTGLMYYARQDTNLTIGHPVLDKLTLFGGYRTGATKIFYSPTNDSLRTTSQGFFVGGSTSYPVSKTTVLGFSLAIASLEGKVSLREPLVDTSAFTVIDLADDVTGNAVGYSLGLNWSGEISQDTSFIVAYKFQRYEFEDADNHGGTDIDFNETFSTVSVGVSHFF